jgi:hypothetical protein
MPPDTEVRLASFTELVATAIANAESSAELAASRRRIVAASDEARRRIERDLHDGVQQQLVSLGLELGMMKADAPTGDALEEQLASVTANVGSVLDALVEIARGIHPAILSQGGLAPALRALARRSAVPVELHAQIEDPLLGAARIGVSVSIHRPSGWPGFDAGCDPTPTTWWRTPSSCARSSPKSRTPSGERSSPCCRPWTRPIRWAVTGPGFRTGCASEGSSSAW